MSATTATNATPVRVMIGSGEASRLERKVLVHSLRKQTSGPLEVYVLNGTHDSVEKNDEPPERIGLSLSIKYRNVTEFSNYRWCIPDLVGHTGRAIYLDSDMICLRDLRELFEAEMGDHHFLAKPDAYGGGDGAWALSVSLIDCDRTRFDTETYFREIEAGEYPYGDLHRLSPRSLARHPFSIGTIDPRWNEFDRFNGETRLIHYTNLFTQPWKYPRHPAGDLWFREFEEAREAGIVTEEDIELSLARAMVRPNLLEGNRPSITKDVLRRMKRMVRSRFPRTGGSG